MSYKNDEKEKISGRAVAAFFFALSVCIVLTFISVWNRINVERLTMEQLVTEKSTELTYILNKLLYKTQTLSTLVVQSDGKTANFEKVASIIVDDPAVLNVLIAPGGVVSNVFPLEGNEAVIGLDFFSDGAGNKEAVMAKESGELVVGGPFKLVQGGQAIVGRLPVFIDTPDGNEEFWGLVSIGLKYPQSLESAGLDELAAKGLSYEIWRTNPDNGHRQVIVSGGGSYKQNMSYFERPISFSNAVWFFRIFPFRPWYEYAETWLFIIIGIASSLMIAIIVQSNYALKLMKSRLEDMAHTDPLTGIYNRRFFMEAAASQADRTLRLNTGAFVVIYDLDHFKRINDTYGHLAGDKVLREISMEVKGMIRTYDLLARYGGEEFIMFITDIEITEIKDLIERIRLKICETPIVFGDIDIYLSASFGVAAINETRDLDIGIKLADKALYKAKEEGRNKIVFYGEDTLSADDGT